MNDEPEDPDRIPELHELDHAGWKALAIRMKQQADAARREADEVLQAENERRAGLGLPPISGPDRVAIQKPEQRPVTET